MKTKTRQRKIRVAITSGDPSGIGPEIIIKALTKIGLRDKAHFIVICDEILMKKNYFRLRYDNVEFLTVDTPGVKAYPRKVISLESAAASLGYLDKACSLLKNNLADCLVTAPVSKEAINLTGLKFVGHTEYLAERFGVKGFAMMFVAGNFRLSLVSRHIPLKDVPGSLNIAIVRETIKLTSNAIKGYFAIKNPRIAVCGLNPHASDGGNIGNEEEFIIKPAIQLSRRYCRNLFGPLAPESAFYDLYRSKYDAAIAMYHDQGLISFKMLFRDQGVNMTLGLPFIRTSPDHGVAFDIAGKNIANPSSMIEAIKLCIKCALIRKKT